MSGLIRNLMTIIGAFLSRKRYDIFPIVSCHFCISPFDCGIRTLKSDKYLQLAESAQLDYLIKTGLFTTLKSNNISFVNASQLIKFMKPIGVFKRVRVATNICYADDKCAYFSHTIFLGSYQCTEILVKMKFKKGSQTVPPSDIIGTLELDTPKHLQTWNQTLEAMS